MGLDESNARSVRRKVVTAVAVANISFILEVCIEIGLLRYFSILIPDAGGAQHCRTTVLPLANATWSLLGAVFHRINVFRCCRRALHSTIQQCYLFILDKLPKHNADILQLYT